MNSIDLTEEINDFETSVAAIKIEAQTIRYESELKELWELLENAIEKRIIDEDEMLELANRAISKIYSSGNPERYFRLLLSLAQLHALISKYLEPFESTSLFKPAKEMLKSGEYNGVNRHLLWDYTYSYLITKIIARASDQGTESIFESLEKVEKEFSDDEFLIPSLVSRILDARFCDKSIAKELLNRYGRFPSIKKKITRLFPPNG